MPEKSMWRRLPLQISPQRFFDVARATVRALGLAWPDDVARVVTETEGDANTMDDHKACWSHGGVSIEVCHSVEHEYRMMESRDRMTSASIRGLPGCSLVWFSGDHYSAFDQVNVYGEDEAIERVLAALGEALATRVEIGRKELALDEWCDDLGDLTVGRWLTPGPRCVVRARMGWSDALLVPFNGGAGWLGARHAETGDEDVFHVVPVGPLPRVLERTSMRIEREPAHNPAGAPGPTLFDFVPIFAPIPFFGAPEVSDNTQKRFRIGRWVIREWRETSGNETRFHVSLQHEQGGPHAAFVAGRFRKDGFVELDVLVVGDGERRDEIERRLSEWLARDPTDRWSVKRRDVDRAEAPPAQWHDDYAERLDTILRALADAPPATVGALCELARDVDGAPGLVSKIRVDGGIDVDPATPLAPGWSIELRLGRDIIRRALVERHGAPRALSTRDEFTVPNGCWIVSWLGPGDTCALAWARPPAPPRPDARKLYALREQQRKDDAAKLIIAERDAIAAGKEPFDLKKFEEVHNRGSQAAREEHHRWNYAVSSPEIRTLADYAKYLHALEPWEDSR